MDNIRRSLEEKTKISFAEVYWYLSDVGTATAQELCEELGLAERVVQNQLRSLEGLGIGKGCGNPKCYSPCSDVSESHLMWLRRFERVARETTRQRKENLARTPKHRLVEYPWRSHVVTCPQDPAVLGYALGRVSPLSKTELVRIKHGLRHLI